MIERRLTVFDAVARLKSFTRAAEAIHMTQPAVTFHVRKIEEHFGTRLFDRKHNRIDLSAAGELVYGYCKEILAQHAEMEAAVREFTGNLAGLMVLGASTTIAEYVLPSVLAGFKKRRPEVVVRLLVSNTEGIIRMVEDNEVDLGIVEAPVDNQSLAVRLLRRDNLVVVVRPGHPLAERTEVRVEEILEYPFIAREEGSGTRDVIAGSLTEAGITPDDLDVVVELGSPEAIKGAVAAGLGITVISVATLANELQLGTLIAVPLAPRIERPFSFVHRKQRARFPAVEEFIEFAIG